MMWVRDERLSVKTGDVVAVTEDGFESFICFVPTAIGEVEALVRQDGVL